MSRWIPALLLLMALNVRGGDIVLAGVGDTWRYQKGVLEPPFPGWICEEFDDSTWPTGRSGFGSPAPYPEATLLSDYGWDYTTVYFRKEFQVSEPSRIHWLTLRADYDDGIVIYLNGQEVLRRGLPGEPNERVPVGTLAQPHPRGTTEELDLSHAIPLLRPGSNLLAVQIPGAEASPNFIFIPEVLANFTRGPFLQSTAAESTLVAWKTPFPADGFVELGTDTNLPWRVNASQAATNHVAALTNLAPGTRYFYRVGATDGGEELRSDWSAFRTLQESGAISFTVIGDTGVGDTAQYTIAERMREAGGDLIMHVGDMIYYGFSQPAADFRCLSVYREQMRTTPMFVALGNHDFYGDKKALLEAFYLPTNRVTGTEHYYSFDHGEAHFTVLWTDLQMGVDYTIGSPQYQWFTNDLATTMKPWKFVFFHHVLQSSGPHQRDDYDLNGVLDEIQLQESIGRAASDYGVDIIFNGHDHCYDKCAPTGGPLNFTSGGGGAAPYGLFRLQPASVQFHSRYHFLRVHADAEEARVEAIGLDGKAFDVTHVRQDLPERVVYTGEWHTPLIETGPANDGDGNIERQRFDFAGDPIGGNMGDFSSPGRLWVNHDGTNLYLGLEEMMLRNGQDVLLFIEVPGMAGVDSMQQMGNGVPDPFGEGADALDFLENLAFTNFQPAIGVILGDEYGDRVSRSLLRPGQEIASGQGAFFLRAGLPEVAGQRLQQYNRSPQEIPFNLEQNASLMELAIPYESLGGLEPGANLRIAVLVGMTNINAEAQTRTLDNGAIACHFSRLDEAVMLEGVEVSLAPDTDHDRDGLSSPVENDFGTDPNLPDTDGDGLPDGWEVRWQFDPLSALGADSGDGDPDGDLFLNREEFRAGTDPGDTNSLLRLWVTREIDGLRITWSTVPGRTYLLEAMNAMSGEFHAVGSDSFPRVASGTQESYLHPLLDGQETPLYFRIQLVP